MLFLKPINLLLSKKKKISIPDATTESEIASTKQIEEKGQTYTFNIEDFQKKKEESIATASEENNRDEDKSAFKKVLQFAKDLKESDGLGELRKAKNELLLINSKKNDYSK
ncbi:hypothetical protein LVD15_16780 [Fulvivirga maritima]|uniref:hypothetical protein n=1 Tax=Fulvivirga maritima TaxID=2904247 RepID=UPI001F38F591|nr:hypothetical protein [Fulvivirga maritima]UII24956.1 hypothetical protein LVD15_16780 [Fulvivirga maritima]